MAEVDMHLSAYYALQAQTCPSQCWLVHWAWDQIANELYSHIDLKKRTDVTNFSSGYEWIWWKMMIKLCLWMWFIITEMQKKFLLKHHTQWFKCVVHLKQHSPPQHRPCKFPWKCQMYFICLNFDSLLWTTELSESTNSQ